MTQAITAIVDNRIRLPLVDLTREIAGEIKVAFEHSNPEFHAKRAMGIPIWNVPPILITWRVEGGDLTLPRGGMSRVRMILTTAGYVLQATDRRSIGKKLSRFPKYIGFEMRWYQDEAIGAIVSRQQGIVRAPTGSGKSELALAAIARIQVPALVILPTGGLFEQWSERASKSMQLRSGDLGFIRGAKKQLAPVTIAMQQSLSKGITPEMRNYFGMVIMDEFQFAAAKTFTESLDQFPAKYRIGITADERRKDKKECISYDTVGQVIYEVKRDRLEAEGSVLDVEIRCVMSTFRADWYGMPTGENGHEKEIDFVKLVDQMTADEARNELALRYVHNEVKAGEQAIMFTARREHARALDRFFVENEIRTGFLLGKETKADEDEFKRTASGLRDGKVRVGIGTYGALGFGIDLPAVSVGCAVTPIASNPQVTNQVRGRLCRPNAAAGKTQGRLYMVLDPLVYPTHFDKILTHNKSVLVMHDGRWMDGRDYKSRHQSRR